MTWLVAAAVDVDALLKVVAGSLAAGAGVTAVFAIAIHGATRFSDMRRDERPLEASFYAVVMALALLGCGAAVAFGFALMTRK